MLKIGKGWIFIGLCFFYIYSGASQNRDKADSLINIYQAGDYKGEKELAILKNIVEEETNPDRKLEYAELLIRKAHDNSVLKMVHSGHLQKGNALQLKGDYALALESYFKSLEIAHDLNDPKGIGALMISIADTYTMTGNSETSQRYYKEALDILRTTLHTAKDSVNLASGLLNAGDAAFTGKNYDTALIYFEESGEIFRDINYPIGIAYNLGNTGMVYAEQGKNDLAKKNFNESVAILEELKEYYSVSVFLRYMANIYAEQNDLPTAFSYAERSLELAASNSLKDQISESNLLLSNLNVQAGNFEKAYNFFGDHIMYRDSIKNVQTVQQMAELRADSEVSRKQVEIDLLAEQKRTQKIMVIASVIALILIIFIALGLYRRNKFISKTRAIIEKEKNRSDLLLRNILPEETAQELKDFGKVKSKRFESVTVLFTDFKDFTKYSENSDPEELVDSVDYYFSRFDEIMEKYDLEKIKTVGDAYMCAGGLPFPSQDHALRIVLAALDIVEFVEKARNEMEDHLRFEVRIGINTGPVVAGIVGKKKFAYDIWGDTVNIAARMETNSEPGRINISQNTYELVKEKVICDYRGEMAVKNKGKMKMYYVKEIKNSSESAPTLKNVAV